MDITRGAHTHHRTRHRHQRRGARQPPTRPPRDNARRGRGTATVLRPATSRFDTVAPRPAQPACRRRRSPFRRPTTNSRRRSDLYSNVTPNLSGPTDDGHGIRAPVDEQEPDHATQNALRLLGRVSGLLLARRADDRVPPDIRRQLALRDLLRRHQPGRHLYRRCRVPTRSLRDLLNRQAHPPVRLPDTPTLRHH